MLIGGVHESHEQSADYILNNEGVNFKKLKYMRRSISPIYDFITLLQLIMILYRFNPKIIHTHAAKAGLLGRFATLFYLKKVYVVHTYHGNVFEGYFSDFKNKIILKIERFLAKHSTKVVSISPLQKEDLVNKYKVCDSNKITVVPLGFDLNRFTKHIDDKRTKTRSEFLIKNNELCITIIGRVVPIKNHKLFIDVFEYCKKNSNKKIKALVVGDGNETVDVMSYSKTKNLEVTYKSPSGNEDLIFASWRSDIDNILAASDVVCLTSHNEGTPVSIIESMASATASISTDVGGVSDIITNNETGNVASGDLFDYGTKLLKLIEDETYRQKVAIAGQTKSLTTFNYTNLVDNIENLYHKLINNEN
jgi:glycosyltransferase involved in cell wall biosynthesis